MKVNRHRSAWVKDRVRLGWTQELVDPVSWGLHPFNNFPVPPRELENLVRQRSYALLDEVRGLSGDEVSYSRLAAVALHDYSSFARAVGAPKFSERWEKLARQIDNSLTSRYPSESEQNPSVAAVADRVVNGYKIQPGANLAGANLAGADLGFADLRGANLSDANLASAKLRGAVLSGANLTGANLTGAKLRGANLFGAKMFGANLTGAKMFGANLTGATMPDGTIHP